jgi:hypothetical protein
LSRCLIPGNGMPTWRLPLKRLCPLQRLAIRLRAQRALQLQQLWLCAAGSGPGATDRLTLC